MLRSTAPSSPSSTPHTQWNPIARELPVAGSIGERLRQDAVHGPHSRCRQGPPYATPAREQRPVGGDEVVGPQVRQALLTEVRKDIAADERAVVGVRR